MSDRFAIKIDATSNGEFRPVPLAPDLRAARRLAAESAPSFATYGPRRDAEYEAFLSVHGGTPL
jgi:hypothetical protein